MYTLYFLYPFIYRWLFELLLPFATVNNADMNISTLIFIEVPFFSSFGYIPNGIARSDSNSIFNILVNRHGFSTEATSFYIPTSDAWVFQFFYILTNTYIFFISLFLSNSYPKGRRWYLDVNPLFDIRFTKNFSYSEISLLNPVYVCLYVHMTLFDCYRFVRKFEFRELWFPPNLLFLSFIS